ncbi:sulfurtransferase TusA family protein [Lichenihabitans sp. Uapishka_5]|uniref:sulfurtransferase TusA family protein n=1 Tax=Lichenihabitans sp. Uapishka_5 TaxID=3037302 RepID=UPI0029E81428|nr:sulfurtransferase TusA family protein [Lichenihabitans sp. Uapishka_5]MDX7950910.1 sulfurtransferase TusA family protein [Lichenihabitans sp. Uapishka_5]
MTTEPPATPTASTAPPAQDLDLRGLRCPMPVLRTRKALASLEAGRVLRVLCTDPLAAIDIPHLLRETGDALVDQEACGPDRIFIIRKC